MIRKSLVVVAALLSAASLSACALVEPGPMQVTGPSAPAYEVDDRSLAQIADDLNAGKTTSEALVRAYLDRIDRIDRAGPTLRSVISVNPAALAEARTLDGERRAGRSRGPLHGVPILIKDNIETRELPTTAGSLALIDNVTGRDAPLVARLRAEGAIVLGKTNLSEWANIRSSESISGWSAVGGQVRNPYALDRNACGSSSGSGAAVAASLAAAAVGTETDGSITCPSAVTGLVGLKPTVGLISRTFVVPISHTQDTPGPMTRTVRDAALLLNAMAGTDPSDPATREADRRKSDYTLALDPDSLRGRRIGVMRYAAGFHPETDALFEAALAELRALGAELVEIKEFPRRGEIGRNELVVLLTELKADLNAYLASTPAQVRTRTLADLIAFNVAHAADEMPLFGQELFIQAEATKGLDDPAYVAARDTARRLAATEGLDKIFVDNGLSALVGPTLGPAWPIDPVLKDQYLGGGAGGAAAVAGYPHLTVPMGQVRGLPVGLSFIGMPWTEGELLGMGYAYEQRTRLRRPPEFLSTVSERPDVEKAFAPVSPVR